MEGTQPISRRYIGVIPLIAGLDALFMINCTDPEVKDM